MHCLQNFTTEEILNKHKKLCLLINDTQSPIYEKGIIKFENYDNQILFPFKVYADIECYTKKINKEVNEHTTLYQKHKPNSVCAKLVCFDNKYTHPTKIFTSDDCINKFLCWVFKKHKYCKEIIEEHFNKKLKMSLEDEENFQNSNQCWICTQEIIKDKVRDHCHITGNFRDAAHKECNSKLKISKKLPVIFHNLEGTDGHIIFRELNSFRNIDIQVIPKSTEKYMSIVINKNIIFLDSLQFLKASLDELADNLEDTDFKHLLSEFSKDKLEILKGKDAYPYDWVNNYNKFLYPKLPPKKDFYSPIKAKRGKGDGHISDEQYAYLQNVWKEFRFKTFKGFHKHNLRKDVLLLADVFEKFITTSLKYYNLDPCHYYSAPGLPWDAMLKMSKIKLEKISDSEKHLFIEDGMRGGICQVSKTYKIKYSIMHRL